MEKKEFAVLVEYFGIILSDMITPANWNKTGNDIVLNIWERHKTDPKTISKLNLGLDYEKYLDKPDLSSYMNDAFHIIALNLAIDKNAGLKALSEFYNDFVIKLFDEIKVENEGKQQSLGDFCDMGKLLNVKDVSKKEEKKEVEKAAAIDSIANGIKNMQTKNVENQKPQAGTNDDVPQRVTFDTFENNQENAASFNKPVFRNERDMILFEMKRRQALSQQQQPQPMDQNAQQAVEDQYKNNVNTGYYTPTVNVTNEAGETVQVPADQVPFSYNTDKNQEVKKEEKKEKKKVENNEEKIPFCKYLINEKTQAGEVIKDYDPALWKFIIKLLKNKKVIQRIYKDTGVSDLTFDLISKESDNQFTLRTKVLGRYMDIHYNDGKLWTIWLQ